MALSGNGWSDPVPQWHEARLRVCELVEATGEEGMEVHVPATPDWRARDLLAHVVGLGHDVLGGEEPDDHDAAWTQRHVDDRALWTVAEILAEWRADAPRIERHLAEEGPRPLYDLIIHEQDLRSALTAPGARTTGGRDLVRAMLAERLGDAVRRRPLAPLRLESDTDDWVWTSDAEGAAEPGAVLRASAFDLTRALSSRRTARQLRSYVVGGDVDPYLDAFAGLGPLPERPLPE